MDGIGLKSLQTFVDTISTASVFVNPETRAIAGRSKGGTYLFAFDDGEVGEWDDPATSTTYFVRPIKLRRAFFCKKTVGGRHIGYSPATNTLKVWDARRETVGTYPEIIDMMSTNP